MDYAIDEMGIQRFVIGCKPMKLGHPILGGLRWVYKKGLHQLEVFFAKIWGLLIDFVPYLVPQPGVEPGTY